MATSIIGLCKYLRRHKCYTLFTIRDILLLFIWKLRSKRIAVISTGSGGIGDYLWIRNYLPLIKKEGYKIILIAMAHWIDLVESFDKKNIDVIRYFESCLSPKRIETFYFKLFKSDVFFNFRTRCISSFVQCKVEYSDKDFSDCNCFYETKNNRVYSLFRELPPAFTHSIPIISPKSQLKTLIDQNRPYVVLVERGNTQGCFSDLQLKGIVKHLIDLRYNVFFNGNINKLYLLLDPAERKYIIDGRMIPFAQHTYAVANALFVITVNTSIYHIAVQLNKPCVVISVNEYHTLKLYQSDERYVFDNILQKYYDEKMLCNYKPVVPKSIEDISIVTITDAIDSLNTSLTQ